MQFLKVALMKTLSETLDQEESEAQPTAPSVCVCVCFFVKI